ncbi:MAG: hypothetical protein K2Z81_08360 [Cyanobacteria bacterium]|nr:hypothetical protein [Cyanobacteriota bacterium]
MNSELTNQKPIKQAKITKLNRQRTGSTLALSCISFALVALAVVIGYSFAGLFFVNNRLQSSTDEIAIAGAKKLNEKDRIGQINNMIVRCRQLVYSSRQELDKTESEFEHLKEFAEPLLDEARESAGKLEEERSRIAKRARDEGELEAMKRFMSLKSTYAMTLPWLTIREPNLESVDFGRLDDVESNVEELSQIEELAKSDKSQSFVTDLPAPALKLYKGNLENGIPLPGADSDLKFKVSSLPAPVDNIVAPTRVILPTKVKPVPSSETPSAVRVNLELEVRTSIGFGAGAEMTSTAAATTTGACPQQ